ncbi:hypothetical protein D1953_14200 [Peribacillus asahii]|uniref:Uncharacterized protein n=1 Tax=Peribacillus asahii TaxID=228899 RepID=A0A398B6A9_9BACI|nr:DL-endopeptidase inhibitor IseA family protein [Peribacillus asahii]RID84348.1 hypothetical protein D1953_14200 [Peribacillus asahii]
MKKYLMAGLATAIFTSSFLQTGEAFSKQNEASKVVTVEIQQKITNDLVIKKVAQWLKRDSYISRGGNYKEGEYKTFRYKNKTYRYLSKDIDTKKELINYLTKSVTTDYAEQYIKDKGIIVHKGKLAQVEADGGSLLQWNKAKAKYDSTIGKEKIYKLTVPVGDTGQYEQFNVSFRYVKSKGWKISKAPSLVTINLDIPFNINPAFIFFKYLFVDTNVSKAQFTKPHILDVDMFKQGITKLEVRTLTELARNEKQVEFAATFDVELAPNYKGSLNKGKNQMFFLIENTGEMEFKIVSAGTSPHLKRK